MVLRYLSSIVLTSLFLLIQAQAFQAADAVPPVLSVKRVDRAPSLDGTLSDPLWRSAMPIELRYEFQPGENTPAPVRTIAYALYDDENLYLGFHCFDPKPGEIRANLSDRDKIFADDYVIVIIDTYGDYQRGYELAVNPYGVQGDLLMTTNGEDDSFDMIWSSAASMTKDGWVAEMAIPFKSLRFPDAEKQTWGINIARNYPRDTRVMLSWTPINRNKANFMSQGGELEGLKDIQPGGSIEVLPYVIGQKGSALADMSDPSSEFKRGAVQGRIGTGFKYAPSSDFAVEMVLNPDFSQVEADADQISVNTTFALYYQERRPFFLESSELIQTPMYYSRSINDPLVAGRVVGKSGSLSYMYLGAMDRHTAFVIPGQEESNTVASSLKSFANIGRLRYNFGDEAYLGAMAFGRDLSGGHNYVFGMDWNYKFWQNWYFSGEGFLSQTKELNDSSLFSSTRRFAGTGYDAGLNGEQYSGSGIHIYLGKSGRDYGFDAVANIFSPTYQTYNGLFSSNDFKELYIGQRYTWYFDNPTIQRLDANMDASVKYTFAGQEKERFLNPGFRATVIGQTNIRLSYLVVNDELFRGIQFRNVHRTMFNVNSRAWDALSFSFYGQIGKFIYRSSLPQLGTGHNLGASITLKPTSQLKIDVSYDRARLAPVTTAGLYYDGYVARTVGVYQLTPEFFLRTILQYNSFGQSFSIYPLMSYKLNAFSTFYAGMTNESVDFGSPYSFTTTNRQFFVKLQYLFRS